MIYSFIKRKIKWILTKWTFIFFFYFSAQSLQKEFPQYVHVTGFSIVPEHIEQDKETEVIIN